MNKKFLMILLAVGQIPLMIEAGRGGGGGGHRGGGGGGHRGGGGMHRGGGGNHRASGHHGGGKGGHRGGHHNGGHRGGRGYGRGYGGRWGVAGAWAGFAMWGTFWLLATAPLWYTSSGRTQQDWQDTSKVDRLDEGIQYLKEQLKQTPNDQKLKDQINELVVQKAKL